MSGPEDPRISRARELLAERRQPAVLSVHELRILLSRFQRAVAGLVDVIDEMEADRP